MGQQIALQEKTETIQEQNIVTSRSQTINNNNEYVPKQGILKISINPFPYASRIGSTINGLPIFAEKSKNLGQQRKERKKQMNFFTQDQILDFIESTVYTLASYEQQNIVYKDLCAKNIFLTRVNQKNQVSQKIQFKLLPNPLIQQTTYERLCNIKKKNLSDELRSFNFSPQMIIANRARQKHFDDQALLKKSNVFSLGMVFLEVATLKSSQQFYDQKTFDIFEQTIEQCLAQIQTRYGPLVVKIIANMVDFDFEERIEGFIQLAKWIIIELENMRIQQIKDQKQKQNDSLTPSVPQSPKSLNCLRFNKNDKVQQMQQQVLMMPVCHQKIVQCKKIIKSKQRSDYDQCQLDKQNRSSENRIKITVREVPVYLQKNSRVKDEKENKSRLMYSPFVNTNRSNQYSSYERAKFDLSNNTKRSLAFQETKRHPKNLFNESNIQSKISRTQR